MPTQVTRKTNKPGVYRENFKMERLAQALPTSQTSSDENLVTELNRLLADEFALFTKTINFHWNIEGPRFNSLHEFLDDQYHDLLKITDSLAERIRMIGGYACGTLNEFKGMTRINEHPGQQPDTPAMLTQLIVDHERVRNHITSLLRPDDGVRLDPGTEDFLTGTLRKHEDMIWRLRSHFE